MTFLPIVERELRRSARRPWTQGLRFLAAFFVIFVGVFIVLGNQGSMAPPEIGRLVFHAVSLLGFGLALLAGMFLTADCLCSEKRDGTLGLLFLTDLRGYDVVLGKLAATSMVSVYALLAILPMMGLPLLMGGVSIGEFGRMVLALLDTLWLSLAAGMLASALCRDTRDAMLATFAQMLFLTGVLFVISLGASALFPASSIDVYILLPSPLLIYLQSGDSILGMRAGFSPYWVSLGLIGGLAALQLALAMILLPRCWQEKNWQARPVRRAARYLRVLAERLALNPFFWLATRDKFPGRNRAINLGLLFALWWGLYIAVLALPKSGGKDECLVCCLFMAYGLHVVVKVLVAMQASQRLCEDRGSGALELLLVTPVTPTGILEGQSRALRLQFRGLLGMLWSINAAMFWMLTAVNPVGMSTDAKWTFALFFLGGALLLPVDFEALGWTGMAEAMAGRRHHRAVLRVLLKILAPPVLIFGLVIFMYAGSGGTSQGVNFIHFLWFSVSLVTSRSARARARTLLAGQFRELASGEPRRPIRRNSPPGFYWVPAETPPPPVSP